MVLCDSFDADLLQRFCAASCESVQSITLQLATLATSGLTGGLLRSLLVFGQLFAAWRAQQPTVGTSLAVRRYGEAFAADLAVLELSGCWSCLLVHLISKLILVLRVVVLIVGVTLLGLLLRLRFRLALAFLVVLLLAFDRIYRILLFALSLLLVCLSFRRRLLGRKLVCVCVQHSSFV